MKKTMRFPEKIGIFKVIRGVDADIAMIEPTKIIIDKLMPKEVCGIIAGTTGSNKSYLAMQMGMSIANDENSFLEFDIKEKGLSVLFVDTEIGEKELLRRYDFIKQNFNWKGSNRFNMISKVGPFKAIWPDLKESVETLDPDVVIIDCLYNSIAITDISKSKNIFPIIQNITELKNKYRLTVFCVHHFNKGGHDVGLNKDRMTGASALQNWTEHLVLMTSTNDVNTRLLKIDKSRVIDYPNCYYGLDWDNRKRFLTNKGIVDNWKTYMVTEEKIIRWKEALNNMSEEFCTRDWISLVVDEMKMSDRTAHGWLSDMERSGILKKIRHGQWSKNLRVLESE